MVVHRGFFLRKTPAQIQKLARCECALLTGKSRHGAVFESGRSSSGLAKIKIHLKACVFRRNYPSF